MTIKQVLLALQANLPEDQFLEIAEADSEEREPKEEPTDFSGADGDPNR